MSPLGFTPSLLPAYVSLIQAIEAEGVDVRDPFAIAGKAFIPLILREESGEARQGLWNQMAQRLYGIMRDEADFGFAVVNGSPPDIGVGCELGFAYALNNLGIKPFPVILFRDDLRRDGETDNNLNTMLLPPYMTSQGKFVSSMGDIGPAVREVVASLNIG